MPVLRPIRPRLTFAAQSCAMPRRVLNQVAKHVVAAETEAAVVNNFGPGPFVPELELTEGQPPPIAVSAHTLPRALAPPTLASPRPALR